MEIVWKINRQEILILKYPVPFAKADEQNSMILLKSYQGRWRPSDCGSTITLNLHIRMLPLKGGLALHSALTDTLFTPPWYLQVY